MLYSLNCDYDLQQLFLTAVSTVKNLQQMISCRIVAAVYSAYNFL